MSMVEAPTFSNGITAELPFVYGGMIHFSFAYVGSDGTNILVQVIVILRVQFMLTFIILTK
jgi:hypothetical protein